MIMVDDGSMMRRSSKMRLLSLKSRLQNIWNTQESNHRKENRATREKRGYHGPWCPPRPACGGSWPSSLPVSFHCFFLNLIKLWYLPRYAYVGSFWAFLASFFDRPQNNPLLTNLQKSSKQAKPCIIEEIRI